MLVATSSGSLLPWEQELTAFKSQLSAAFNRAELRRSASAFIDGLLSGVARKTGWQLAEQAGLERPYRLQSLSGRSSWQADRLRDMVRADVLATLGDGGGVLVVDETGFLRRGPIPSALHGSIPPPRGGWRTVRSAYSSPMRAGLARR